MGRGSAASAAAAAATKNRMFEEERARNEAMPLPSGRWRRCRMCAKPIAGTWRRRYCGDRCRKRAQRARDVTSDRP